jgi:hypothetical protein
MIAVGQTLPIDAPVRDRLKTAQAPYDRGYATGGRTVDVAARSAHIDPIGTLPMRVLNRNLAALATACESDAFVATQLQES